MKIANNTQSTSFGKTTLIYSAPPNPNGDLHLGHLAGPYLAADVLARHRIMLGNKCYYLVGTDDNQCWTAAKAKQIGTEPQETADAFAAEIKKTFEVAKLDVDLYYRPNERSSYRDLISEFVDKLYRDGNLLARESPALFCDNCEKYLFEAYVSGECPHCGEGCCGNACEECGLPNDCVDMINPKCKECGTSPTQRKFKRLYFPLEPHRQKVMDYHRTVGMASQHRALCHRLLSSQLPEIVASHYSGWGIPVPIKGFEGQCVSAWIEMAPGYLAASAQLDKKLGGVGKWKNFWKAKDVEIIQFFGSDNCWTHGVLNPALLKAFDPEINLPSCFISNELYLLDRQKFSTSRNHAVWAKEFIEEFSPDTVRLYVSKTRPESKRTNFSRREFEAFVTEELVARWGRWLAGIEDRMSKHYKNIVPEPGNWTENHHIYLSYLNRAMDSATRAYQSQEFSPRRITEIACAMVRNAEAFHDAESAWYHHTSSQEYHKTVMSLELMTVKNLAMLLAPITPGFTRSLWLALGYSAGEPLLRWESESSFVPEGQSIQNFCCDYFSEKIEQRKAVA